MIAVLSLAFLATSAFAKTIDTEKSIVNFKIKNMKIKTVHGTFKGMKGEVVFDEKNLKGSKFNVTIDPATVDTDNKKRDDHLRNPDFFDVEKYPTIRFESKYIQKTSKGFKALGKLSLYSETKQAVIHFTKKGNKLVGNLKVDRMDYKLSAESNPGTAMIGQDRKTHV